MCMQKSYCEILVYVCGPRDIYMTENEGLTIECLHDDSLETANNPSVKFIYYEKRDVSLSYSCSGYLNFPIHVFSKPEAYL